MTVAEIKRHMDAERELGSALEAYAGRWVAVKDREVVADAETLTVLLGKVQKQKISRVFKVPEQKGGAAFY